ncbi:MAG TPA: hypothetical protein VLH79_05850 [Chthonomonadales bacterium]|nr:hypothetical protein [Chthonomonadales bacterium]
MRFLMAAGVCVALVAPAWAQQIENGRVTVRAVRHGAGWAGFDVLDGVGARAVPVVAVRWTSGARWSAARCVAGTRSLRFDQISAAGARTPTFGSDSLVEVSLRPGDPYPHVRFRLSLHRFDEAVWLRASRTASPFYFLRASLLGADERQLFYQGGLLFPGPNIDPFPITQTPMRGDWAPNWSYAPAIGANPIPAMGLWAPASRRFAAFEFQEARLTDRSDALVASAYCAGLPDHPGQFWCLVYPHAADWLRLRLPAAPVTIASRFRILHSRDIGPDSDPNRYVLRELLATYGERLPPAPSMNDMAWLRQGLEPSQVRFLHALGKAPDYPRTGVAPILFVPYERAERVFFDPGAVQLIAHQTGKAARYAFEVGDRAGIEELRRQIEYLIPRAVMERHGEDVVWVWNHPLEGQFRQTFGGAPATGTRHMFNWGIASAMLWFHRVEGAPRYLPFIDGMVKWTRHYLYDRAGMADLPWAVFSMGAANAGEFLLDYWETFRSDPERMALAEEAWRLAETVVFRNTYPYTSDPLDADDLDPTFLLQAVNSHFWIGQVTWGEMGRIPEMAIQMYLETGDPYWKYLVRGLLERFHIGTIDLTGRYTENMNVFAGGGLSGAWGANNFRWLAEPLGGAIAQINVGPRAAIAFNRGTRAVDVAEFAFSPTQGYAFTVTVDGSQPNAPSGPFDIHVTSPRRSLSGARVLVDGAQLPPERFTIEPAGWNALIRGVRGGNRVEIVKAGLPDAPALPTVRRPRPPAPRGAWSPRPSADFRSVDLRTLARASVDDSWAGPWAGLPTGPRLGGGIAYCLIDPVHHRGRGAVSLAQPATVRIGAAGPIALVLGAHAPVTGLVATCEVRYVGGTVETVQLRLQDGTSVARPNPWYDKEWWLRAYAVGRPGRAIESVRITGPALLFGVTVPSSARGARAVAGMHTRAMDRNAVEAYGRVQAPDRHAPMSGPWWRPELPVRYWVRLDPRGLVRRDALLRLREDLGARFAQAGLRGEPDHRTLRAVLRDARGRPSREVEVQFSPAHGERMRGELLVRMPGIWRSPVWLCVYLAPRGSGARPAPAAADLRFQIEGGVARASSSRARLAFALRGTGDGPRLTEMGFAGGPNLLARRGHGAGYGHLTACQDFVTWYDFGALQTEDAAAEVVERGPLAMTIRVSGLRVFGAGPGVAFPAVGTAGERRAGTKGRAEWWFRLHACDTRIDSWVVTRFDDPNTAWTRPMEVRLGTADPSRGTMVADASGQRIAAAQGPLAIVAMSTDPQVVPPVPNHTGEDGDVLSVLLYSPKTVGYRVSDRFRFLPRPARDGDLLAEREAAGVASYALETLSGGRVRRPALREASFAEPPTRAVAWRDLLPHRLVARWEAGQPDIEEGLRNRDNPAEGVSARTLTGDVSVASPGAAPSDEPQEFLYFDVADDLASRAGPGAALIAIEYLDVGRGTLLLEYDSMGDGERSGAVPDAFKDAPARIQLQNTGRWRVHVWSVPDARFANHCNGADLRIAAQMARFQIRRAAVAFPDRP